MIVDRKCLWLNRNWVPIDFRSVRTTIENVMRDQAAVIHPITFEPLTFEEWVERAPEDSVFIKTSGRPVPMPEVIVLKKYGEVPERKVGFNRQNLFRRDQNTCQYCGDRLPAPELQIEHVMPRSRGGPTSWENCVAACDTCNSSKADKTPAEANMRLRKKPTTPSWKPGVRVPQGEVRPIWLQFLKQGA